MRYSKKGYLIGPQSDGVWAVSNVLSRMLLISPGVASFGAFARCVLILGLCSLPESVLSQSLDPCMEGASLWLPSDTTSAKSVAKWQGDQEIKFAIVSSQKNSSAAALVEAELSFVSHKTGLRLAESDQSSGAPLPDLLVVIDPDLAKHAPILREIAQKFFEQRLLHRFQIDAEFWNENLRKFLPKCVAFDIEAN